MMSLSEFAQQCWEDDTVNRVHESLRVFKEVINSRWFTNVPFILAMNKADLVTDAMARVPFNMVFSEYTESNSSCTDAIMFLKNKFEQCTSYNNNKIFPVMTSIINTSSAVKVFEIVKEVIMCDRREDFVFDLWDPHEDKCIKPQLMLSTMIKFSDVTITTVIK
jgi:hypothetical protein